MLSKCCVYGCSSNYKSKIKDNAYVTMYRFPFKSEDRELWIKKLPNANFVFTTYKQICAQHWPEDAELKRAKGGSYVPIYPPSVFKCIPVSCIPIMARKQDVTGLLCSERSSLPDGFENFKKMHAIQFNLIAKNLKSIIKNCEEKFYVVEREKNISSISYKHCRPISQFSIYITLEDSGDIYFTGYSQLLQIKLF